MKTYSLYVQFNNILQYCLKSIPGQTLTSWLRKTQSVQSSSFQLYYFIVLMTLLLLLHIGVWSGLFQSRRDPHFFELQAYPSTITGVPACLRVRNNDWDNRDRKTISTGITTLFHSIRNITDKSVYTAQTRALQYYLSYSARKQVQSATFFTLNAFMSYLWAHILNCVLVRQADQQTAGNFLSHISSLL